MRTAFGVFLIAHALVHLAWVAPKPSDPAYPFNVTHSRLLPNTSPATLKIIALVLVAVVMLDLVLAGLGVMGVPFLSGIWRLIAVEGAVASLAMVGLFWNPYFIVAPFLDAAIIAAALLNWPKV
ncbi:MAG: hypothetical protein HGA39_06420 [Coriobacteriia bacterium]|nr:hypothetical protein [Coriobacteriia bacterium]